MPLPYLTELLDRPHRPYIFREQSVVWMDGQCCRYYTTTILETAGWNRFDYSTFDHGELPSDRDTDVMVYVLEMHERRIPIAPDRFVIDETAWNPVHRIYRTRFSHAF